MAKLEKSGQETNKLQLLLQGLHFDAIRARHDRIQDAHARTFQWVLESDPERLMDRTKFVDWLRGDRGIFWIRGKPGSGKSTLMKYIAQHPKALEYLSAWSKGDRVLVAKYFFWNSGTSLEKSEEGLLRSLLFDILRSSPELADTIEKAKSSYGTPVDLNNNWSRHELLKTLEAVSQARLPVKICFFIDGLDEYKGDTSGLLSLIQRLVSALNIKLCISSRPWTEFVDAFGCDEALVIQLEDLTQSDIHRYVVESLESNQRFTALAKDQAAYNSLADEVVFKAKGVFLWVELAIRSLLQGAKYADSIADMRKRVEELPDDLDAFFESILADVPPRYLQRTALTARVILAARRPLYVAMHYFIDELFVNPGFALEASSAPISCVDSQAMSDKTTARLDGRFKGLLEVAPGSDLSAFHRVHFIHRTAGDYLESRFMAMGYTSINPFSILCHAALALFKCARSRVAKGLALRMFAENANQIDEGELSSLKIDQASR